MRIKLSTGETDYACIISRVQFPVRLCFAITINKAQGQSFKAIGVDLRILIFSHGQLYVAMSRVTDVNNISILVASGRDRDQVLRNVVYPEG